MPHDDSSAGREVHNGVTGNGGGSIKRRGAAARGDDRQALRALGRTGVTFAEWDICVAAGACPKIFDNGWGRGDRPVILVSWEKAKSYVTLADDRQGLSSFGGRMGAFGERP